MGKAKTKTKAVPNAFMAREGIPAWTFRDIALFYSMSTGLWYRQKIEFPFPDVPLSVSESMVDKFLAFKGTSARELLDALEN